MAERITELAKRLQPYLLKVASSIVSGAINASEGPGIDVVGSIIGLGGDTILLYDSAGAPVAEYGATEAGLTAALAAATSGQVVLLPACTIAGSHTVPALVHLQGLVTRATILTGTLTVSPGGTVTGLSVTVTANSADELDGVIGPGSGAAYLQDCVITVTQSGAGASHGIHGGAGDTYLKNCSVETVAGTDLHRTTGSIYADETALLGLVKCSE